MFLNISEDTRRIFKRRILLFKSSLCTYLALSVGFLQISGLYLYLLMKKKKKRQWRLDRDFCAFALGVMPE